MKNREISTVEQSPHHVEENGGYYSHQTDYGPRNKTRPFDQLLSQRHRRNVVRFFQAPDPFQVIFTTFRSYFGFGAGMIKALLLTIFNLIYFEPFLCWLEIPASRAQQPPHAATRG